MPQLHSAGATASHLALNRIPLATYRLQLRGDFDFADVQQLAEYLSRLGITDLYLAPLFRARRDSSHGYDVVDPGRIEPEFGGRASFTTMARQVRDQGMGILLDVVPNHMGINDPGNRWWNDVLENGQTARYASYFDVDWDRLAENLRHKILLPLLGDQFGKVLEKAELKLRYAAAKFFISYYDYRFPITPRSWPIILGQMLRALVANEQGGGEGIAATDRLELESVDTQLQNLPPPTDFREAAAQQRYREQQIAATRLSSLIDRSKAVQAALADAIELINGIAGKHDSFDTLERLLDNQNYRLAYWQVASDEINYRRFFDINDLAAIRVEKPEVFKEVHALVAELLAADEITGLRIDHPDGLLDPGLYFEWLQRLFRDVSREPGETEHTLYIVVEKILTGDEPLPNDWQVSGTTGYDLMNHITRVLLDEEGTAQLREVYPALTGVEDRPADVMYRSKKHILREALASEVSVLAGRLHRVTQRHRFSRDFTFPAILRGLREIIACFPVYRTYVPSRGWEVTAEDHLRIMSATRQAKRRNSTMAWSVLDFLAGVLLLQHSEAIDESEWEAFRDIVLKFQQLTGPVTAKGIEDTAFYRYYPLASLNEVGGELDASPLSIDEFHRRMQHRAADWPHSLSATATHDTKRGEDFRARLNVLAEVAEDWATLVSQWETLNAAHVKSVGEEQVPNRNEVYFIYQTLVGTWPLSRMDHQERNSYTERLTEYLQKALREAKLNTSWTNPVREYEQAVSDFLRDLLDPKQSGTFLKQLDQWVQRIADAGFVNSLAQVLIKVAVPGVPDFYQGTEYWDFHLVDPDNRRPVDYHARSLALAELQQQFESNWHAAWQQLLTCWPDDRIKLFTVWQCLAVRQRHRQVFESGDYLPLKTTGDRAQHVLAWARRFQDTWVIAATTLRPEKLSRWDFEDTIRPTQPRAGLPKFPWGATRIELPAEASPVWTNAFSHQQHHAIDDGDKSKHVPVSDLLSDFPIALLCSSDAG